MEELQRLIDEGYSQDEAKAKLRECDICHSEDVDTEPFRQLAGMARFLIEEHPNGIRLCPYCYNTYAGNALMWGPPVYNLSNGEETILKALPAMFNLLEKRLRAGQ